MKKKIFTIVIAIAFLIPILTLVYTDTPGWEPHRACSFLEPSLTTGLYEESYFEGIYHCFTPYKEIWANSSEPTNNLTYYAAGDKNIVKQLKIIMKYNQPEKVDTAKRMLLEKSAELSLNATNYDIPDTVFQALSSGETIIENNNGYYHEVKKVDRPSDKGYEVHYILYTELLTVNEE